MRNSSARYAEARQPRRTRIIGCPRNSPCCGDVPSTTYQLPACCRTFNHRGARQPRARSCARRDPGRKDRHYQRPEGCPGSLATTGFCYRFLGPASTTQAALGRRESAGTAALAIWMELHGRPPEGQAQNSSPAMRKAKHKRTHSDPPLTAAPHAPGARTASF